MLQWEIQTEISRLAAPRHWRGSLWISIAADSRQCDFITFHLTLIRRQKPAISSMIAVDSPHPSNRPLFERTSYRQPGANAGKFVRSRAILAGICRNSFWGITTAPSMPQAKLQVI